MYKTLAFSALLHRTIGESIALSEPVRGEIKINNAKKHTNCDPTRHQSNGYDCGVIGKI